MKASCRLIVADVVDGLRGLPDESVHTIVTSPPYWGLRRYNGVEPTTWGGNPSCEHEWGAMERGKRNDLRPLANDRQASAPLDGGAFCLHCCAWRGLLGLEPRPDCLAWARSEPPCASCHVCHMRTVFAEVRRVLREDGTLWLNYGDCWFGGKSFEGDPERTDGVFARRSKRLDDIRSQKPGRYPILKPKDLVGLAWRVALALQADGWWLRMDCVWAKGISFRSDYAGSSMPSSVRDRPAKTHEYVYLLAKSKNYFYDWYAVRDPPKCSAEAVYDNGGNGHGGGKSHAGQGSSTRKFSYDATRRNLRSVWAINPESSPVEHFAVFPERLVEPCILAGTSEKGVCPSCGAPWRREVESDWKRKRRDDWRVQEARGYASGATNSHNAAALGGLGSIAEPSNQHTAGWSPTCCCLSEPVPATVLDPFVGSGTTAVVAVRLGRSAIGIDASAKYLDEIARPRLELDARGRRPTRRREEALPLFGEATP